MTLSTVSTYGSLQTLLQNMNVSQNSLNNDQIAISSGQKSQTFDGLGGDVEQLTALNSQVARLTNYQQTNAVVTSQLQTANTSLTQVQQLATSLKSLIASQLSGTSSTASFQQQLKSDLSSVTAALNTTFQGNYLFSGTATNTPPIKTPLPAADSIGQLDTSYYQGSDQNSTIRINDNQTISNSIRADDPAFQNIYAGAAQALQSNPSTADLQHAEDLVSTGIQGVIALQAGVNGNLVNVQQVDSQSQTLQTYFTGLATSMTQSDPVSLSTKVAQDQTVLEASFEVFSRISSLSLVNYLK